MITRETTIEAYKYIIENGILSRRKLEVFTALYDNGEKTSSEILDVLMKQGKFYSKENPNVQSRMFEAPALVRGTNTNNKIPSGFKEVLSRVAEAHPESPVGDRYGKKTIKNVKTKEIVKKFYDKYKKR